MIKTHVAARHSTVIAPDVIPVTDREIDRVHRGYRGQQEETVGSVR